MRKHIEVYRKHFEIGDQDVVLCEACHRERVVDIHHLVFRSHGGSDQIDNLVGLCRSCHNRAHNDRAFNEELKKLRR